MKVLIGYVRKCSPSRALMLVALFCLFCLSSCAAAEEVTSEHRLDAGVVASDRSALDEGQSPFSVVTPTDVSASFDIVTAPRLDTSVPSDQHMSVSVTLDVEPPQIDAVPLDTVASFVDTSGAISEDRGFIAVDTSRVSIPDIESPSLDIPIVPDVPSPPDVRPVDVAPSPPPPPPSPVDAGVVSVDAGRTDGCHELVIRLQGARLSTCLSGWVAILYDSEGHPHESAPGSALSFTICGRLRGALILSARCGGDYLLDWPGLVNHPANEGGIASITLDGNELADAEALLCLDRFSPTPGIRPAIPLEPFFYGRCP